MTNEEQSIAYHSIQIFVGTYYVQRIPYRIGDDSTMIADETENHYDTWIDFHLIPTEMPTVALPNTNVKLVNIPGKAEPIDLTDYLTGHPTYSNRMGNWSFYTDQDYVDRQFGGWVAFDKHLRSLFHGRVLKVVLRDDPAYFYVGEISVQPIQPGDSRSVITLNYNFYPYKKSLTCSMELWKWDEFDFVDGTIEYMKDMSVSGTRLVDVIGSRERISPHISGSSGLQIDKYENSTWKNYGNVPTEPISSANSIIPRLVIEPGVNQLRFRGNGTVTIDYRRGML